MRHWFTTACLTAAGVLMLVVATGTENTDRPIDPVDVLRQLGVSDSIAEQWVEPYVPLWALTQDAPVVGLEESVGAFTSSASTDCSPSLEIQFPSRRTAYRFDSTRGVTELYNRDYINGWITRYDVAPDLSYTTTIIPLDDASPWIAEDLDGDGDVEIVSQWGDVLLINSSPDGTLLASFQWPAFNVEMNPIAVNIDGKGSLEIFVTPHTLGFESRVVVIAYDSVFGTFEKIVDYPAPERAVGRPAACDFDSDGRMEIISGSFDRGYHLYEWQESSLVLIGLVGDSLGDMNYNAIACHPLPGGLPHALLGHSGADVGYHYQLLEPVGDNAFEIVRVFQQTGTGVGVHPCDAADVDCDGLEEIVLNLHPWTTVWGWNDTIVDFTTSCEWHADTFGLPLYWHHVDLDQNRASEWATTNTLGVFRTFPDPACLGCDTLGDCHPPVLCTCRCFADPECDSLTDVLDVVGAVDVAFRSAPPVLDPFPQCPVDRTDVDCSGFTNVLDVVHLVNVAFRSADPTSEFCNPCP